MSSLSSPTTSSSPNPTNDTRWGPPLATIQRRSVSARRPSRFSIDDWNASPVRRSVASPSPREKNQSSKPLINGPKNCKSSPTTQPEPVKCSSPNNASARNHRTKSSRELCIQWHRLYLWRRAIRNSLVRIGPVDGDLVKRFLIRPLPHQQIRRSDFQPKPSRLSVLSNAGD